MTDIWKASSFLIARADEPRRVAGYEYRGLGLWMAIPGSPKGRRPPTWSLTHLGSGHLVCRLVGTVATAFPVATEIAECADWDFDGLDGWKNRDPFLPAKVLAIVLAHPRIARRAGTGDSDHDMARQIAEARS